METATNKSRLTKFGIASVAALALIVTAVAAHAFGRYGQQMAGKEANVPPLSVALSQVAAEWQQAIANRNGELIAAFMSSDVQAMYPQPLPTVGRDANRAVWTAVFEAPDFVHPITIDQVVESEQGDLGYTYGRWWAIQPSTDTHVGGRFVAVWQPIDGSWQIVVLSALAHEDVATTEPAAQ